MDDMTQAIAWVLINGRTFGVPFCVTKDVGNDLYEAGEDYVRHTTLNASYLYSELLAP